MQSGSDLQARERKASLCGDRFALLGSLRFHLTFFWGGELGNKIALSTERVKSPPLDGGIALCLGSGNKKGRE